MKQLLFPQERTARRATMVDQHLSELHVRFDTGVVALPFASHRHPGHYVGARGDHALDGNLMRFSGNATTCIGDDGYIPALAQRLDGGHRDADLGVEASNDQLFAARCLDRAHHFCVLPGVDERPVDDLLIREDIGNLRKDATALVDDHRRQDRGHVEGLGKLRQRRRIVDHHLRVMAVERQKLEGLVVDQKKNGILRAEKRIKAVAKIHDYPLLCRERRCPVGNMRGGVPWTGHCHSRISYGSVAIGDAVSQFQERSLDIEELRTFVEVADAGGITAGAQRLGLSKSIVSRRLARLEQDLGVQLLARTTRGASLTEAGETLRNHAAKVIAEIDIARETILPAGELRGRLRIAAPLSFGPTHLAPVLAALAQRHPNLHVHTCYSDRHVDLVSEGYDCAIRLGYLPDSNLIARRVGPIPGRLVATPDYVAAHGAPDATDDLLSHECLMQGTESWQFVDGDKLVVIRPHGRFKADNGTALVSAALAGLGIAMLPEGLVADHLASGALVSLMDRYPVRAAGMFVVRPPSTHPARKVRVLTEMLIECFEGRSGFAVGG